MFTNNWDNARDVLRLLVDEAKTNPIKSLRTEDHNRRTRLQSPLPGFLFEVHTSWMLNSSVVFEFQAERSYFFGLYFKSLYTILEVLPDGTFDENPIYTRLESCSKRQARRAWLDNSD